MVPGLAANADLWPDGAARQGLPTSPALANLAAAALDREILALSRSYRLGRLFVYTRYADDLTFSFSHPWLADWLKARIPAICERHGLPINPSKTHLQAAVAGRRMITGVAVDTGLHAPRSVKRRIRAAEHQLRTGKIGRRTQGKITVKWLAEESTHRSRSVRLRIRNQLDGLREWSRLKLPKAFPAQTGNSPARARIETTTTVRGTENGPVGLRLPGQFARKLAQ